MPRAHAAGRVGRPPAHAAQGAGRQAVGAPALSQPLFSVWNHAAHASWCLHAVLRGDVQPLRGLPPLCPQLDPLPILLRR